jgi:ribulose-phosphate 3-epimerase
MEISISLDPSVNKDLEKYLNHMNGVLLSINEGRLGYHVDVMDGKLVERAAVSADEYKMITTKAMLPIDVHLAIMKPHERIDDYLNVVCSTRYGRCVRCITFQVESLSKFEAKRLVKKIQKAGFKAGIAVDLDTYVGANDYKELIEVSDVVLIMAVKGGKPNQVFSVGAMRKVQQVKKHNPGVRVIVEGGINPDNINKVKRAGVDTVVLDECVYSAKDRRARVLELIRAI